MKNKALIALKSSIAHWGRHRDGTAAPGESIGVLDCHLCVEFYRHSCAGCPISDWTDSPGCRGTLHSRLTELYKSGTTKQSKRFRTVAGKFVLFLELLLPKNQ